MNSHRHIDERSRDLHQLIADKIRLDPGLMQRPRQTLQRWTEMPAGANAPYLAAWNRLFSLDIEALLRAATEDNEAANALRQCSPFCGVLSNRERFEFLKNWRPKT